jgi:hypothetical protein
MAKYIIHQQQTTYSWYWECKHNPSINGTCNSKREARREAREKCRNGEASITPPSVSFWVKDGILIEFSHENLLGESQTFSSEEISESVFEYLFGYENEKWCVKQNDFVCAELKVWGIYIAGTEDKEIIEKHNLTEEQYNMLFEKSWDTIELEIDADHIYHWLFK